MVTVSVIVPTVGRPELRAAVESISAQVGCSARAVVVLDRPEREQAVRHLLDGLNYVLVLSQNQGAAAARNRGLEIASDDYIGYLDDDDLWAPTKASAQIAAIEESETPEFTFSVVASRFMRSDGGVSVKSPRAFNPQRESFANYLVARRRLRYGSVFFNTPALLGRSALMKSVRWDEELIKHEDWDVLVRLYETPGVQYVVLDTPLVVVNQGSQGSLSARSNWCDGQAWLTRHNASVTGRARADFVLLHMFTHAVRMRSLYGVRQSVRAMGWNIPHLAALIRCAAGLALGR